MNMDDLYRILRVGHAQAQGIVDTIIDPLLVLDGSLCVQAANRSFFEHFGVGSYETIGRPVFELGDGQWDIAELRRLLSDVVPKSTAIIDYEVKHNFPGLGPRTMLLTARTLHQPDGQRHAMLLVIVDVTERKRQETAKDLVFGELRHRLRNLLAVMEALIRQTKTEGRTTEEYREALIGRIRALTQAEEHAFNEQQSTDLKELVGQLLAPYTDGRNVVEINPGAEVELSPRQIMSLSIVVHEMATNSAKYGALSANGGRLCISWRLNDGGTNLTITWLEKGGPAVVAPAATGFGTRLIRSTIENSLGGKLDLIFAEEGLRGKIIVPLVMGSN